MSANNLNIGIAGSAVNPLCDIFHMPDRVAGKTYETRAGRRSVPAPHSGYKASTTINSSSGLSSAMTIAFL
jgi:hypothetical protein